MQMQLSSSPPPHKQGTPKHQRLKLALSGSHINGSTAETRSMGEQVKFVTIVIITVTPHISVALKSLHNTSIPGPLFDCVSCHHPSYSKTAFRSLSPAAREARLKVEPRGPSALWQKTSCWVFLFPPFLFLFSRLLCCLESLQLPVTRLPSQMGRERLEL